VSAGFRVGSFFAALFAAGAGNTAFLPLWFADRGLTAVAIGQVLGAASLLRVFAGPSWGTVADRIGRRRPVMLAAAITASAAALCYLPLRGFTPLLLIASVQGVASSALNPLIDSLALALARDRRMEYGPVRSIGSLAYMAASAGGGWLLSVAGSWVVPWLLAATYGSAAVVTPLLPEADRPPAAPRAFAAWRLLSNRPFRLTVLASALIQGAHAAYYGFAPLFWRSQGISDSTIGLLIAEGIVAEVA
jgi:PPP family 3-phenylpropionic acid transporter